MDQQDGQKPKRRVGRPTEYKPEYAERATNFCLLGLTDEQIAGVLEIAQSTFYLWKKSITEFSEALKKGREDADAKVTNSLFKRAMGYKVQSITVKRGKGGVGEQSVVNEAGDLDEELVKQDEVTITVSDVQPDVTAQIFWLKNRRPDLWRDKKEVDNTHKGTLQFIIQPDDGNEPLEG